MCTYFDGICIMYLYSVPRRSIICRNAQHMRKQTPCTRTTLLSVQHMQLHISTPVIWHIHAITHCYAYTGFCAPDSVLQGSSIFRAFKVFTWEIWLLSTVTPRSCGKCVYICPPFKNTSQTLSSMRLLLTCLLRSCILCVRVGRDPGISLHACMCVR